MIVALALIALAQDTSAPRADDIVVRSMRKLEDWRGVLVFERDTPTCRVVKSANDADLDAIGCQSMVQCFTEAKPRYLAIGKVTRREARQARVAANRDMDACFKTSRMTMVQQLTKRREAAATAEPAT